MNGLQTLDAARLRLDPLLPMHADAMFQGLRDERLYEFITERAPASLSALRDRYRMLASRKSPDLSEEWLNWALWSKATVDMSAMCRLRCTRIVRPR